MKAKCRALTVYRIRDSLRGKPVEKCEDVIAEPEKLVRYHMTGDHDFEAQLFVAKPNVKQPPWVEFLKPGFGELSEIEDAVTNSAVLVAKLKGDTDCLFALTFGFGRYLLRPNIYEQNYGLRVALNILYPGDGQAGGSALARVRSVDAKTVAANTFHTRRQADRRTAFEDFGFDVQRDLLRAVTGQPIDYKTWGKRLSGAHSVHLNLALDLEGLGDLLREIEDVAQSGDYPKRFDWIGNLGIVVDQEVIRVLERKLEGKLRGRDVEGLQMAPPELVDWDEVSCFRVSVKRKVQHDDLDLDNYLDLLQDGGKLKDLSIKQLRQTHKLEAVCVDETVRKWPMFRCISGELELDGETYLISGGDFFRVSADYLGRLNRYIEQIPECDKVLPDSTVKTPEDEYNELAANSSKDYLLLDKKTVTLARKTSPIEICDILSQDGCFIHVKRKLASSSLSHLFAQGYVSGDLFHMSREFREAALGKIKDAEKARADAAGDSCFLGQFCTFDPAGILPRDYEVVYAIVANWKGRTLVNALPFFSKVNLRRHTQDLHRMGYRVSYKRVHAR